ncbi:MAG: dephospho-CoA kinase [Chloroflexota bacterium]|nr:dephospho-CoA kinase [Chloroflexota bacterium]
MRIIGLTGGIGSGKSTVSAILRELGAAVVDADEAARAVVEPGQPALEEIRQEFGEEMIGPGDRLDRRAMARRVFDDEGARRRLNAITHPRVREWMAARIQEEVEAGAEIVVMDTPLLYEAGLDGGTAETVVVWVPEEVQVERAVGRGMEEADVRARIRAQMSLDDKRGRATHVIDNSGSRDSTREQTERLWRELSGKS